MYRSAFVGQVSQKRSATAVNVSAFKSSAFVEKCKSLGQAVCVEACPDALLAGKEWILSAYKFLYFKFKKNDEIK